MEHGNALKYVPLRALGMMTARFDDFDGRPDGIRSRWPRWRLDAWECWERNGAGATPGNDASAVGANHFIAL